MVGDVGIHGVTQSPLLPQLLKQTGGAAAAQNGVEQQKLIAPLVQVGQAGEGQNEMVLLNGLFPHGDGAAVVGLTAGGSGALGQGGQALHKGVHVLLGEAARQRDHHGLGAVVLLLPLAQPLARYLLQGGSPAQNGPAQGVALVHRHGQPLGTQVLGGVLVHADLLQNDAPLHLHVPLVKAGGKEHVAQQIHRPVQVAVQTAGVVAGVLLGGVGVYLAADGVHLPGQVSGGAGRGALEGHMLNEVGGAVFRGQLVAGARSHKKAQGGGAHTGDALGENAGAVGQCNASIHDKILSSVLGFVLESIPQLPARRLWKKKFCPPRYMLAEVCPQ